MRIVSISAFSFLLFLCAAPLTGCGSNEPTVAPRTEDEIAAAEAMIYGSEEEDQADTQAAEED